MGLKALVIEDSLVFQKIMGQVLKSVSGVDTVSVAANGTEGLALVASEKPDVVFLDLHLPDMDGMEVLVHIKNRAKETRVVVVSGLSSEGADLTVKALSRGAQHFISKPSAAGFQQSVDALRRELEPVIKTVSLQMGLARTTAGGGAKATAAVRTSALSSLPPKPVVPTKPVTPVGRAVPLSGAPVVKRPLAHAPSSFWVVGLATSTGGPEALTHVIPRLPANFPLPIVLVQHMPPLFTQSLAQSLNNKSLVTVKEGQPGDILLPGHVYIAPGGKHMVVRSINNKPVLAMNEDPPEQSVRPAADVLFRSLADYPGRRAVLSVVMTGMGEDGLAGIKLLNVSGTYCLTQSEDTCVVYGMPRAVDAAELSNEQVSLNKIADRMVALTAGSLAAVLV